MRHCVICISDGPSCVLGPPWADVSRAGLLNCITLRRPKVNIGPQSEKSGSLLSHGGNIISNVIYSEILEFSKMVVDTLIFMKLL